MVVHRAHGQQRRDEGVVHSHTASLLVRKDNDLGAVAHLLLRRGAQRLDGLLEPLGPIADRVDRRGRGHLAQLADRAQLVAVEDGAGDAQLLGELGRGRVAKVAPLAERHVKVHHDALAQWVDGWVGHLREALLKVVVERVRLFRQDGEGRVLSQGEESLLARIGHVAHLHLEVLERPAKRRQLLHQILRHRLRLLDVERKRLDNRPALLEPLAVGSLRGKVTLHLLVLTELARLKVERDHVARAEPPLAHHLAVVDLDDARLGHEPEEPILGLQVARGAQSVAIERRAELLAVAEDEESGAVPRLLQPGVVLVHRLHLWVVVVFRLLAIRLGHEDREREGGRLAATPHKILEDGVEVRRVRLV